MLLKFQEAAVRRDHDGRFAAFAQRWTDAKGGAAWNAGRSAVPGGGQGSPGWQALGSKVRGIPTGYTGSREKEAPAGSYKQIVLEHQIPKAVEVKDHQTLFSGLVATAKGLKKDVIEKAEKRGLLPEATAKGSISRAFNHAALFAMHDFNVVDYDFHMDDHLKEEMMPLEPFIRYARRRVIDEFRSKFKGQWKPYRAAFGKPFKDMRRDKQTGEVRLRTRANHVLVKAFGVARQSQDQGVLPPQPGISRWDRYRAAVARNEALGQHDQMQLTYAQRMERVRAAKAFAIKRRSGAPMLQQGMPGSLKGDAIGRRDYGNYAAKQPTARLGGGTRQPGMQHEKFSVGGGLQEVNRGLGKRSPGAHPDAIRMMPSHLQALIHDPTGHEAERARMASLMPPEVAGMMNEVHGVIARHRGRAPLPENRGSMRHAASDVIANPHARLGALVEH